TLSEMSDKLFEALRDLGYDVDKESVEKGARGYYSPEDQASSFASFAFKRLLYKVSKSSQHQLLSKPWTETRCPVCGLVPIASIEEFEDEKAPKVRYKCMCGNSWEFDHFVCPNCKNDRAEDFEIQHVGRVPVYICKKCGHLVLMANSKDIVSPGDEEVLPIVAAIAINAMMSSEEEEDFIESPEGDEHDET
ncbi:MAG: formate dehydrogenase accessory protein FdhE, partial [Acidilobaceae archaeon]